LVLALKLAAVIHAFGGTLCMTAFRLATMTQAPQPFARAASVESRVLSMSGLGETRSYGRQSQAGKDSAVVLAAKKRMERTASSAAASSSATNSTGPPRRREASAAT